jgi:adenylate cyclase, class 2
MKHKIIEIKAKCDNHPTIRKILENGNAQYKGTDHQKDTYFVVSHGRLKLREGNIENSLIHYFRDNVDEPKASDVFVCKNNTDELFKELLIRALGILVVVDKVREIYFIDNVKFHLDKVDGLGEFVEIEAIGNHDSNLDDLMHQCRFYLNLFEIQKSELITHSYSDLLIQKKEALS